jgi:hypothetical protein
MPAAKKSEEETQVKEAKELSATEPVAEVAEDADDGEDDAEDVGGETTGKDSPSSYASEPFLVFICPSNFFIVNNLLITSISRCLYRRSEKEKEEEKA